MAATVAALAVVLQHEHDPAMEELRRELAAARRANEALTADKAELEWHLKIARANSSYTNSLRLNRQVCLSREGDRLARWAAQGRVEEDMPTEILRAVRLMRQDDDDETDEVDESDDDAEMEVDSAAVP
jgi:hypothetical protein